MAISMSEAYLSRDGTRGEQTSYDLVYYTFDETNEVTAEAYLLANIPQTYRGYNYRTVAQKQITESVYMWTVNYGSVGQQIQPGVATLAFRAGGGTVHVTNSISNRRYRDSNLVPKDVDYQGAIGVELNDDGSKARVRGVDVYAPVLEYSYAEEFLNNVVTTAFIDNIYSLCGKVNSGPFFGRPAKSVLFMGAQGSKKGNEKWEIRYDFAYSPNVASLRVGGINVGAKDGWEYLDVLYVPNGRTNNLRVLAPGMATVHQVYESGDFSLLGL